MILCFVDVLNASYLSGLLKGRKSQALAAVLGDLFPVDWAAQGSLECAEWPLTPPPPPLSPLQWEWLAMMSEREGPRA